ncbi:hypothetical protein PoB_000391800 [Plakobranchus ocellatus]|uniref:Uncharacterized protein n=1 Tax=Plakobranchus ocellatus TaxID=259542 RepID=A0AAV3Y4T0_9GAST|nr:hypothetical protein PoB_000391800 [Plakobranchus ocellatus]
MMVLCRQRVWLWWKTTSTKETVKDLKFGDDLSAERRRKLEDLAGCFPSIFSDCPHSTILEKHRNEPTSSTPVWQRQYSVPYAMKQTFASSLRR